MLQLSNVYAQKKDTISLFAPSPSFALNRFAVVAGTEAVLYSGSLIVLSKLWYAGYPHSSFHFFNDDAEWMLMDKAGHTVTSYIIGRTGINLFKWSGVERKKAIWYGGALGPLYQSTIELLDGFSSEWGFSFGDFSANMLGSAFVIAQELAWDDQRISLKYSFHQSTYAKYRPEVLGSNMLEQMVKDYNGQTYWASANIYSFLNKKSNFPTWLNIALGYGAEGMTGGSFNPPFDKQGNALPEFSRYNKFYLSFDVDLTRIKTKSHFLKAVFNTIGFIKIPAPALQFDKNGVKGYWIYF